MRGRPLGEFLHSIEAGKSLRTQERPAVSGELGILKVSAVTWGIFDPHENKAAVDPEVVRGCPWPRRGDVLISRANTRQLVGAAVRVERDHPELRLSDKILRLNVNPLALDAGYLLHFLRSSAARQHLEAGAGGSSGSMLNISQEDLRTLVVPSLALAEQRRIANVLDKADALRRKRREVFALTDELLRATFLEMFGDPVTNPRGWPEAPLGALLALPARNGLSPCSQGSTTRSVLTLSAITRGGFDASARKDGLFEGEPPPEKLVSLGEMLVCRGNGNIDLVGAGRYPTAAVVGVVFPDTMIAVRPRADALCEAYLESLWNAEGVRAFVKSRARTTNGTFKINQQVVEAVPIPVPPLRQQQTFSQQAQMLRALRSKLEVGVSESEALFAALQHRAFRGEI